MKEICRKCKENMRKYEGNTKKQRKCEGNIKEEAFQREAPSKARCESSGMELRIIQSPSSYRPI